MEGRVTRASKRRRISPPTVTPPQPSRESSPDELASDPPITPARSRRASTRSPRPLPNEPLRPSYSPVSDTSADELGHTSNFHTFYRNQESYPASVHGAEEPPPADDEERPSRPPSPLTPEYSRISSPAASDLRFPEQVEIKEATFVPFKLKRVLKGHRRGVAQVRFSPDGKLIASCSADATIRIWDATSGKCLNILEGHLAGISTIAWAPDSKTIASGSDDKSIRLWNAYTGKPHPHPFRGHHNYIYNIAIAPKGNLLVSGSYDEAVMLWDVRTRNLLRTLPAHSDPVGGVDFVLDGTLIASCAGDGLIRIWDTATGQCLRTLVHEDNAGVTAVRFSPNGKFVLAWTLDSCVRLWNYIDGRCVKTYQGHENKKFSLSGCFGVYGLPPDGERHEQEGKREVVAPQKAFVVSGSEDGSILCWDVVSKTVLSHMPAAHDGVVLSVDWRPPSSASSTEAVEGEAEQEELLVSCGTDRTVKIWEKVGLAPPDEEKGQVQGDQAQEYGGGEGQQMEVEQAGDTNGADQDHIMPDQAG